MACIRCKAYRKPLRFFQKPLGWAIGRSWWLRLPILIWFAIMLQQNLNDTAFALQRLSNPFSALDMGMHELGHELFSAFGEFEFMHILGGSLFQCLFPLLWILAFLLRRWYFAASMCVAWLGLNFFDVATYAADARARILPLAMGLGGIGADQSDPATYDRGHDWYQILSRTNSLESDALIASGLRAAGTIAMLLGLLFGSLLLIQMLQRRNKRTTDPISDEQIADTPPLAMGDGRVATIEEQKLKTLYPQATKGTLAPHEAPVGQPEDTGEPFR